jgi:hypothetical protein
MNSNQYTWRKWASFLQHLGVIDLSISLLEIAGPLTMIAAQVVYFCQPLIRWLVPLENSQILAEMLDEPDARREFVRLLKEEYR